MMGFIASIVEAYGELRVNKGRVLLALLGVAFSVFAMTGVLGGGEMLRSAIQQRIESESGRQTTIDLMGSGTTENLEDVRRRDKAVLAAFDRLDITFRSRKLSTSMRLQTGQGVVSGNVSAVDPAYAAIYRTKPAIGRWLTPNDAERMAPTIVLSDDAYSLLGRPPVGTSTARIYPANNGDAPPSSGSTAGGVDALIIGVLPPSPASDNPGGAPMINAFIPAGSLEHLPGWESQALGMGYVAWVPPGTGEEASTQLKESLKEVPGGPMEANTMDMNIAEELKPVSWALLGVATAILILGAMGLLNISLVTVRYRMREIGIRRSYGATGLRVFVGVLMESVVATAVAGFVGVAGAIALLRAPFVQNFFAEAGLVDLPPFPLSAVVIGMIAAISVGALAGIIPALIATRIKVIDAIRA